MKEVLDNNSQLHKPAHTAAMLLTPTTLEQFLFSENYFFPSCGITILLSLITYALYMESLLLLYFSHSSGNFYEICGIINGHITQKHFTCVHVHLPGACFVLQLIAL